MRYITHIVSVSGGKDSTATLLLALRQFPGQVLPVFADTGNEHELTYEYLGYLEQTLGIKIVRLRQDFTDWWWRRQEYIRDKWPLKGVPADVVQRAVAHFDRGPSGNRRNLMGHGIHATVQWAKTFRGGKAANPEWDQPAPACASSYGLCE